MKFSIFNFQFSNKNLGLVSVLVVVGFLVYAFNLNNPLFWDDTDWIVNNPFVHSFSLENIGNWFTKNTLAGIGLKSNYYRPFLFLTFALNYIISGTAPLGYHLVSNGLHVLNAILIFYILLSIFKNKFVAFWSALLWLVHPLQTEAVTYISGRGDPLTAFFMLLILYLWTNDVEHRYEKSVDNSPQRRSVSLWALSTFFLILALLSRETAIVFPFLFMVFYIAFVSRERFLKSLKQSFVKALPYFSIVFVYGILRLTVLNFDNTLNFYSKANLYTESFLVRMYTFLNVLLTYAKLLILPLGQHMERSVTIYTHFFNWPVTGSFLLLAAVLGLIRYYYKKQKYLLANGQINDFRLWFFAVGWFFVNLGPTSGITPINAQLYEHWLYLAMLGPIILAVYYLDISRKRYLKAANIAIIFILLISVSFFSVLSVKRNIIWGNPIKFFEDILKYEPDGARINNNLGNLYYDKGEKEKAEEYYWKAVSIEDNFPQPHFNLGSILQSRNDIRGAIVEFEKALEIDPNFPYAYQNLAVIYAGQGDLINAANALEKLKTITPYNSQIYYNLALIYLERKDNEFAYQNLQEGLKYGQFDPETESLMRDLLKRFEK
ncbi:MAG: tetratricopeptide repeat protein, partial [Patescibacteria group bacterium]